MAARTYWITFTITLYRKEGRNMLVTICIVLYIFAECFDCMFGKGRK